MFEDNSDFNFDDDVLTTSFSSANKSQNISNKKHFLEPDVFKQPKKFKNLDERNTIPNCSMVKSTDISCDTYFKKIVKRKFPGPAGLLPENAPALRTLDQSFLINDKPMQRNTDINDIMCSQSTYSVFEDCAWNKMCQDFTPETISSFYLPEKYNIQWIKTRAEMKKLLNQKAPFLAALIQSLETDGRSKVDLTLKDMTGEIQATMLYSLYETFSEELSIGSVIIIKQFGVFTAGDNRHYLTITNNNLITIYTKNKNENHNNLENEAKNTSQSLLQENPTINIPVNKIVVQPLTIELILNDIQSFKLQAQIENKFPLRKANSNNGLIQNKTIKLSNNKNNCTNSGNKFKGNDINSMVEKCNNMINQNYNLKIDSFFNVNKAEKTNVDIKTTAISFKEPQVKKKFNFSSKKVNVFNDSEFEDMFEINFKETKTDSQESPYNVIRIPEVPNNEASNELLTPVKNCTPEKNRLVLSNKNVNFSQDDDKSLTISSSQISVTTNNEEHQEIWKNVLEDIDADSLFDDDF